MRLLLLLLILLAGHICCISQESAKSSPVTITADTVSKQTQFILPRSVFRDKADLLVDTEVSSASDQTDAEAVPKSAAYTFVPAKTEMSPNEPARPFEKYEYLPGNINDVQKSSEKDFDWKGAMYQSALLLAVQHGFRMTEEKTRSELDGPFFRDWRESVANLKGWDDNGKFFTNYIAHPMQGSIYARIFVNNSPNAKSQEFGKSKEYWLSRMKALAWSAAWSTQFEIGPISEASFGNVGQRLHPNGVSPLSYIDLVLTPTMGTGLTIVEDAVDRYLLKERIEKKVQNRVLIKLLRSVLTPMTGFANLMRFRAPWWREDKANRY